MQGELFGTEYEAAPASPGNGAAELRTQKHNRRVVHGSVSGDDGLLLARYGSVVVAAGEVEYHAHGQGVDNLLKRAVTGEGLPLMEITGDGDVWLGDGGHTTVIEIGPDDWLSVAGRRVLAFTPELSYTIRRVPGVGVWSAGMTNTVFTADERPGRLAISAPSQPLVVPVLPDRPVQVDPALAIGWSAQLRTSIGWARDLGWAIRGGDVAWLVLSADEDDEGFVIVSAPGGQLADAGGGAAGGGGVVGNVAGNIAGSVLGGLL